MAPTSLPRTSRPFKALRARTASSRRSKLTVPDPGSERGELLKGAVILTKATVFVGQNSGRFNRTIRTKDAQDGSRSGAGRNGTNPEGASRSRLQLGVHTVEAPIGARVLAARRSAR